MTTIPFDGDREAVGIVNASRLGLTAAVFSADLERALAVAESSRWVEWWSTARTVTGRRSCPSAG